MTGATGYLGGALGPRLLARRHRVLALGPGHLWPYALFPVYALAELIPATRDGARRLGLVTRVQMTRALASAVESQPAGVVVVDVPGIRAG